MSDLLQVQDPAMLEQTMLGQDKAVALFLQYEVRLAASLLLRGVGIEPNKERRAELCRGGLLKEVVCEEDTPHLSAMCRSKIISLHD